MNKHKKIILSTLLLLSPLTVGATNSAFEVPMNFERLSSDFISTPTQTISGDSAPASWGGPDINTSSTNTKILIEGNRNGDITLNKNNTSISIGGNMYGGFSNSLGASSLLRVGGNLGGKSTFNGGSTTLDIYGTLGNEIIFSGVDLNLFVSGNTSSKITVNQGNSNVYIGGSSQSPINFGAGNDSIIIQGNISSTSAFGNGKNYLYVGKDVMSSLTFGNNDDTVVIGGNISSSMKLNAGNDNIYVGGTLSNAIDGGTGINSIELGNHTFAEYQASSTLRSRIKNFTNIRFKDKKFIGDEMVFLKDSEKTTICILETSTGIPTTQIVPKYSLESRLTEGNYIGECESDVIGKWYSNSFFGGIGEKISDNQSLIGTGYYSNLAKNTYGEMLNSTRISLNKGKYEISYRVKISNNTLSEVSLNLGAISLTDSQAGSIKEFYAKDFSASNTYETKKLTFEVTKDQSTFSPYVFVGGKNDVWVDEVTIKRLNTTGTPMVDNSQNYVFEDKDFTLGVGKTIVDQNAQNNSAITSNGKEGFLFFGPYSTLQLPGTHKAVFRLKSPDVTSAKIMARIEVFNTDGDGTNVVSYIRGMDFKQANVYQNFELIYNRTNTGKIEYRIFYYNLGNITFDNVTDYGAIGDTTAIELRDFAVSNNTLEKKISLSFTSNKKLKNPPVVKIGTQSQATFLRVFENTYSYEMTYTDSMFGTAQITANSVQDLFGNTLETVSLGTVEFKDTKAPNITNIQISHEVAKSFDTVSVSFMVDEELPTQPIVKIGTQKATFVEKVSGVYTYVYTVNEISETPTQKQEVISIQVMDESGNIKTDTSASVTLDINNSALVFESEELPANVGQINNSNGILHRTAQKFSTPGYLQFGPYTNKITQNTFQTAKFRLKTNDNTNSEVLATIDVLNPNGSGQRVLKQVRGTDFTSANTWQEFDLDFFRTNDGVIEFRIYATGKGEISSDRVMVVPYIGANSITYESENLYGVIGDYVTDSSASGNKAIKATLGTDKPGTFQFGPYTTPLYAKSSYTANFRLKIEDNSTTQYVALIDVYDEESGYREYKELKASDFDQANVWQDFDISFIKPTTKNIEFRIFFYGTKTLYADKVDIIEVVKPKLPDYESENLPGLTGLDIVDMDASGKMARTARVGTDLAGVVQFGPYDATNMVDGQAYKVKFRLKTPSNTTTQYIGLIDAFNGDSDFRKYIELRGVDFNQANTYQDFEINFVKPVGKNMEYRLFFYGVQDITIDKIWIEEGVYEGLPIYESEKLPSKAGKIIVHQDASGGKGLYFDRNLFAPEWIQFGPYKMENVNVGENYKANFVLSTTNNGNTNVIAIINVFNIEKGIDYRVPIRGTDFSANDTFQTFSIDFNMIDTEFMEFRVFATGEDNLMTDKVYISK